MRWCRTNATCRKSSGIRVWVSPTSRTICAVCWNAGWSVAAAKAASFGIVWRTGGSPISSVMQISYLPRQPTELMPAKAIRTNRRDLLQCPIGAPNLKQPSAHPQRMHPLTAEQSLPLSYHNCFPTRSGLDGNRTCGRKLCIHLNRNDPLVATRSGCELSSIFFRKMVADSDQASDQQA